MKLRFPVFCSMLQPLQRCKFIQCFCLIVFILWYSCNEVLFS